MLSQKKTAKYFKLPRTFFYENLLKIDPFELRDELFDSHQDSEGWRLVETLLFVSRMRQKKSGRMRIRTWMSPRMLSGSVTEI